MKTKQQWFQRFLGYNAVLSIAIAALVDGPIEGRLGIAVLLFGIVALMGAVVRDAIWE